MERHDYPVVLALCALSASVALAFGRVFGSTDDLAPVIVAAVLPHLVGAVVRGRRAGGALTALASAAALGIYLLVAVPGTGSPAAIADRLSGGWRVALDHDVPLPATAGTVLLAVLVVWVTAALADDLAFRWHATLGAIAPGVMVLIWIAALGTHDGLDVTVAVFGGAATVFVATQHQVLLRHERTRLAAPRMVDAPRLLAGGIALGILAMVTGVALAPVIPGGEHPLFDQGGLGGGGTDNYRTSVPPLLDIGNQLRRGEETQVFTVRASSPDYWRITALDEYRSISGGQWTLTAEGDDAVGQGLDEAVPSDALTQRYRIGSLSERWMPAAYQPVRVSEPDALVIRASSTLVTDRASVAGLRYTVESALPTLVLDAAQRERAAGPVSPALRQYTQLPDDFPTSVINEAVRVTTGLTNPYDKALALRDYFRDSTFVYDVNIESRDDESAIAAFLTERRGFCVQFASAYATMARAVGIPARVAVGFTTGTPTNGVYEVSNWDAHAWPEVWLADVGWTHAFDPTPSSNGPGGSDLPSEPPISNRAPQTSQQPSTPATTPATTPPTDTNAPSPPASSPAASAPNTVTVDRDPDRPSDGLPVWALVLGGGFVLLVIVPVLAVVAAKARRRVRRRTHADPAVAVAGAWSEAIDDLADHRHLWPHSDTPRELARRVRRDAGDAAAVPLRAIADSYNGVRYGDAAPSPEEARQAWREVDALRNALDQSGGFLRRVRARLDPSTLRRTREPV